MPLINCETTLNLIWSVNCVIFKEDRVAKFAINDTNVTLSIQDNTKLLQQSKQGFKRTINWNKYQSKVSRQKQNRRFNYSIDPSFQGVNILFVL